MDGQTTDTTRGALRACSPFAAAGALAWTAMLIGTHIDWVQYAISTGLALLAGGLGVLALLRRPWARVGVVPGAVVFLAAVALLRNSVGGLSVGSSALAIIPVFYAALYSASRRELAVVVGGVGASYLAPILLIGPPGYPHSQYRNALLSVAVASIVGFATQRLVASVHRQAEHSRWRERMLTELTDVVHRLSDSPQPRGEVCDAARRISDATVAVLYEPSPEGALQATASVGIAGLTGTAGDDDVIRSAFDSGRPVLWRHDVASPVWGSRVWASLGRPGSLLLQPLMRHGVARGVLVLGWTESLAPNDPRPTLAALLAHEAAAVIARADAMHDLADEAQTDPLTGLPNRRAWDAQLKRAVAGNERLTVAMLDFDHFKQFNDTHGHPAGDRLLKETAAAWREQLRAGDLLARLGGEEFGLLLRDCDPGTAVEVTERLRRHVSMGRSCSAGIAIAGPGETAEAIVARADQALYQAKARGRDRIQLVGTA